MPIVRWICPLTVALTISANWVFVDSAPSAELPIKANKAAPDFRPSGRLCTDMNGKKFRWSWANVPFASVCSEDENDAKPPPQPRQPAR